MECTALWPHQPDHNQPRVCLLKLWTEDEISLRRCFFEIKILKKEEEKKGKAFSCLLVAKGVSDVGRVGLFGEAARDMRSVVWLFPFSHLRRTIFPHIRRQGRIEAVPYANASRGGRRHKPAVSAAAAAAGWRV